METIPYVEPQPLSLLWPGGIVPAHGAYQQCDESTIEDLDLDDLARALAPKADQLEGLKTILMTLVADPAIITYRHEVLEDLFGPPLLDEGFGTAVDNSILRVGMEDERDQVDDEVRDGIFWSEFDRFDSPVKRDKARAKKK